MSCGKNVNAQAESRVVASRSALQSRGLRFKSWLWCPCVEFVCLPHACVGYLWALLLPSTFQKRACEMKCFLVFFFNIGLAFVQSKHRVPHKFSWDRLQLTRHPNEDKTSGMENECFEWLEIEISPKCEFIITWQFRFLVKQQSTNSSSYCFVCVCVLIIHCHCNTQKTLTILNNNSQNT